MKLKIKSTFDINNKHLKILKKLKHKPSRIQNQKLQVTDLLKQKFIDYDQKKNEFLITQAGFDAITIQKLKEKGLKKIYRQIGVGKESEIYLVKFNSVRCAMKIHRIGRKSFKTFRNTRLGINYTKEQKNMIERNKISWIKCSEFNCKTEFNNLVLLKKNNFLVPEPFIYEDHILIMEYIDGLCLFEHRSHFLKENQSFNSKDELIKKIYEFCDKLYSLGYVHNDFNEFNIMIKEGNLYFIDFTQLINVEKNKKIADQVILDIKKNLESFIRKKYF